MRITINEDQIERIRRILTEAAEKEKQTDPTLKSIEVVCGRGRRRKR